MDHKSQTPMGSPLAPPHMSNSDAGAATTADEAVLHPGGNDVMFGRGGDTNYHVGNSRFRTLVAEKYRLRYQEAKSRKEKSRIAMEVIQDWRSKQDPPGRFLAKQEGDGTWYEVSHDVALKKALKVLGEKTTKTQRAKQGQKQQQQQETLSTIQLQQLKYSEALQQSVSPKQPPDQPMMAQYQQAVAQQQPYEHMISQFQQAIAKKQRTLPRGTMVSAPHAQHPHQAQGTACMESRIKDMFHVHQEQEQRRRPANPPIAASVQQHQHVQPFRTSTVAAGPLAQPPCQEQARTVGTLQSVSFAPAACTLLLVQDHFSAHQEDWDGGKGLTATKPDAQADRDAAIPEDAWQQSATPMDGTKLPSAAKLTNIFDKEFVSSGSSEDGDS